MRNLESFILNPFSDPKISLTLKKKFGEDGIQRIAVQNTDNRFDGLINDTIAAQTNLFGAITTVGTISAIQQARTQSVNNIINRFKARNSRFNAFLVANAVDKLPVYQEFFPAGISAFTREVTKGTVEQRMKELVTAITANTAIAGGPAVLAEYQDFLTSYNTARGSQLGKISELSSSRENSKQAEASWDDQMFSNLLIFANLHRGHPEKLVLYMNQTILRSQQSADSDGRGQVTGTVTTGPANLPAAGVSVHVVDGNINDATTAADGSYRLQSLPVGQYDIVFTKQGFAPARITTDVEDEGDTLQDAVLQPL
jgi:hypothetical protein